MKRVDSLSEIQELIWSVKNIRRGFFTNFYLDEKKHRLWIEEGQLEVFRYGDNCLFLCKNNLSFVNVFYLATDMESLKEGIEGLSECIQVPIIVDIVSRNEDDLIKLLFQSCGFQLYESLYRMSHSGEPTFKEYDDSAVVSADLADASEIKQFLDDHFDPLSEQIPSLTEVRQMIENNLILVNKSGKRMRGFIIYELNGMTLYLRYWYVSAEYRNLRVGSTLYNRSLQEGKSTKRQMCWVVSSNENAIEKHRHYGFEKEKMYDFVLIKK